MNVEKGFYWQRFPAVEKLLLTVLAEYRKESPAIRRFEKKLLQQTSVRLLDCLDHFVMKDSDKLRSILEKSGFIGNNSTAGVCYSHPGVCLPPVRLSRNSSLLTPGIAVRVECISDFIQVNNFSPDIKGSVSDLYRCAEVSRENGISMFVVERRGTMSIESVYTEDSFLKEYTAAVDSWKTRPREQDN